MTRLSEGSAWDWESGGRISGGKGADWGGTSNEGSLELGTADSRDHQAGKGRCAAGRGSRGNPLEKKGGSRCPRPHNRDANLDPLPSPWLLLWGYFART